ncbi:FAD dependent oxidoreductase-like protein [Xylogone sp. PMI_703]|nr:FAD dependent oxidoreductase-like protein [Xylogone sp. PMI_703]
MVTQHNHPDQSSLPTPNSTKSFWHSQPAEKLLGHRTTESVPQRADVVIVGSGISGAFAARFLRDGDADLDVVMVEAREACWGATGRNGGHCQPLIYGNPPDIGAFELRNWNFVRSFITSNNIPCEWRALPACHSYMSHSLFQLAVQHARKLQDLDPELGQHFEVIEKDDAERLKSLRVPNAKGVITTDTAASLWPYKLVSWVLEQLLESNPTSTSASRSGSFNLQTNTPVTRLQKLDDSSWIVHTDRGMIAAKNVLLCTNAYTSHLLPAFSDLIVPVRGEMSSLLPPKSLTTKKVMEKRLSHSYGFVGHATQNINQDDYLVQRPFTTSSPSSEDSGNNGSIGGELMFGGGRAYAASAGVGVSDDSSIDPPAAAYLRRELNVVLDLDNDDHELTASYEWSGIMGFSRDERPWVGSVGEELGGGEGLWVCAGYTGHGMPNAVLCAKAAVELMLGRDEDDVDLPRAYRVGAERVEKARMLDEVRVADARDSILLLSG